MADRDDAPPVVSLTRNDAGERIQWIATLSLPAGLRCFQGHFPSRPVLAGVTQLQWAATLYQRCYEDPRSIRRVTRLKFMRVVRAGETLQLCLEAGAGGDDFGFSYWVGSARCTVGRIHLSSADHAAVCDRTGV